MERYNYRKEMLNDINDYIECEGEYLINKIKEEEAEPLEFLNDYFWTCDSITGNASGSYWCNTWKAEEAICHNLDLLSEAMHEFCCDTSELEKGAEWADLTIRCWLLCSVLYDWEESEQGKAFLSNFQ